MPAPSAGPDRRPDRDFLSTVECLRVRRRDGYAEITYKPASTGRTHSSDDIIAKPETNLVLAGPDQADAANDLLDLLGMVALCEVEKTRTTYRAPEDESVSVAIDVIAGVGAFVETEVMGADVVAAARLLDRVEREIELCDLPPVGLPYRDLVRERGSRR